MGEPMRRFAHDALESGPARQEIEGTEVYRAPNSMPEILQDQRIEAPKAMIQNCNQAWVPGARDQAERFKRRALVTLAGVRADEGDKVFERRRYFRLRGIGRKSGQRVASERDPHPRMHHEQGLFRQSGSLAAG